MAKSIEPNEGKNLADIMQQLSNLRNTRRALEKARQRAKIQEFKSVVENSGNVYLEEKKIQKQLEERKRAYKQEVYKLQSRYNRRKEEIIDDKREAEINLNKKEARLAAEMSNLDELRKHPIVQGYESKHSKMSKQISDLEGKKGMVVSEDEKNEIQTMIDDIKINMKVEDDLFYSKDIGKEYKRINTGIDEKRTDVKNAKSQVEAVNIEDAKLEKRLDEAIKRKEKDFKREKSLAKSEKSNPLIVFMGKIRAKLGIGKYTETNNLKSKLNDAILNISELSNSIAAETKNVKDAAEQNVSKFFENREKDVINALSDFFQKKIDKEQDKINQIHEKNPDLQVEPEI